MPDFQYTTRSADGQQFSGILSAASLEEAAARLRESGAELRSLAQIDVDGGSGASVGGRPSSFGADRLEPGSASLRRLPLTLLTHLRALGEELRPKRARAAVEEMADRIEQGEHPAMALKAVANRLPTAMTVLIELGLAHGEMDRLLSVYVEQVRRTRDMRSMILSAIAYPACLLMMVLLLLMLLAFMIAPTFERMFGDFGISIPIMTRLTLQMMWGLRVVMPPLLIGTGVIAVLSWLGLRQWLGPSGPWQVLKLLPLVGPACRWSILASCTETLALLLDLRLSWPMALRTAADLQDDRVMTRSLQAAATEVEQGVPIEQVAALPEEIRQLAGGSGNITTLIESLRATAEVLMARAKVNINLTLWLVEPLLIFLVAVLIGFTFISLFHPLITLTSALS